MITLRFLKSTLFAFSVFFSIFTAMLSQSQNAVAKTAKKSAERTEQRYGSAGCGLGSLFFKTQTGLIQIFASITNASTGSQTFGISSGTSNCEPANSEESAVAFIEVNRIPLEKDVSRGSGETLVHFSKTMGCTNPGLLGSKLQKNFTEVFTGNQTAETIKVNVESLIQSDRELRGNCRQESALAGN